MNGFDANVITQFGVAGFMFAAFMFLLKWVLKTQDKILNDAKEERAIAIENMRLFQKSISEVNETWRREQEQSTAYIDHARAEHQKMIDMTTEACKDIMEFRKDMQEAQTNRQKEHERIMTITEAMHNRRQAEHEKTMDIMEEQLQCLARINGFKNHAE